MHPNSQELMLYFREKYLSDMVGCKIIDIGSKDVNGTYKGLFKEYLYTGMDIEKGPNVDILCFEDLYNWVNQNGKFDVLITGQTLEHVKRPWDWLKNLKLYFSKYICVIAPNTWKEHRYPIDTYRYFPDGLRDLFEYAGIEELEIFKDGYDTIGIGIRREI